jgi:hypothetical protein
MQVDEKALEAARQAYQASIPDGAWHADGGKTDTPMRAAIDTYLSALGEQEPVAWQGRDHQDDRWTFLRKPPGEGAWAETRPLYTHPRATVTDEAVERAAKAIANEIHVGGDFGMTGEDAYSKRSAEFICLARAALEAASREGRG